VFLMMENTKERWEGYLVEGFDPQDLYAQNHPLSQGSDNVANIHKQWELECLTWGNITDKSFIATNS